MISGYLGLQKHPWGLACAESLWDDLAADRGSPSLPGGAVNQRSGLRRRCQRSGHNASRWAAEGRSPPPVLPSVSPQREKPPASWVCIICVRLYFWKRSRTRGNGEPKIIYTSYQKRSSRQEAGEREGVWLFWEERDGVSSVEGRLEHLHCPLMASWQGTNLTESRITNNYFIKRCLILIEVKWEETTP